LGGQINQTQPGGLSIKRNSSNIGKAKKETMDDKFGSPIGFIIQNLIIQLNRPEDVIIQ
jgi:hypothetical protein